MKALIRWLHASWHSPGGSHALLLASLLLAAGCGAPQVAPFMRPPAAPPGVTPESNIAASRQAWNILADPTRRSEWPAAREAYNLALAACFDDLRRANSDWDKGAAAIGTRWAGMDPDSPDPDLLGTLFPASAVDTSRVGERQRVPGVGLPLVGWIDESTELYAKFPQAPPAGISANTSLLLRFDRGPVPSWEIRYPYHDPSTTIGGHRHPLECDFSAAHALYWRMSWLDKHRITNVLVPDRVEGVEGLFFAQPLSRDRIPLVLVHGFKSTPDAFATMTNELMGEEWFRRNYQVWFFSYPTGVPWMLSAARFRKHLNDATAFARNQGVRTVDRMVVIGHSMGGLITQASLRDPGDSYYSLLSDQPLDQLELRPDERDLIREMFLWKPLPQVARAVFLAAPHRGSPTALTWYSTLGSKLIRLPKTLTVDFADALLRNTAAMADPMVLTPEERLRYRSDKIRMPTAIESLTPDRSSFRLLGQCPLSKRVHLHSVIGDRGRGDGPESSDGVVPYWSSHLPEAESERMVPADHGLVRNPEAIDEVKRILELHLKTVPQTAR